MRLVLFALTGLGNPVLEALLQAGLRPDFVGTRREAGPFPYYPERQIFELAEEAGIPCVFDEQAPLRLSQEPPDVLVVASYHRILPAELLARVPTALNIHPSLLPRYRGPNPFYWVIRNGEAESGVTIHRLTAKVDEGSILWQQALTLAPDETQGSLRRRLAALVAPAVPSVVRSAQAGTLKQKEQDPAAATAYPNLGEAEYNVDPRLGAVEVSRCVRALAPFPGATIAGRKVVGLLGVERATVDAAPGTIVSAGEGRIRLRVADADILLCAAANGNT